MDSDPRRRPSRHAPRILPGFFKAHGHGNDYLVFEEGDGPVLTPALVRRICDRHRGPGGDGIVVVAAARRGAGTRLRMFNPDGGEFERSGNGLRVAGVYLRLRGKAPERRFAVTVGGDLVGLRVWGPGADGTWDAIAEMGKAGFPSGPPFVAPGRAGESGTIALDVPLPSPGGSTRMELVPVALGNPHAVAFRPAWTRAEAEHYGPLIAADPVFPRGINVQFAEMPAGREVSIRIWERGVGRTTASGTSACATVAAAVKSGLMAPGPATVLMEGGSMEVEIAGDWSVRLRGPVEEVCFGELAAGFLAGG